MIGKTIKIYLANGSVTGIRYAELINWTGQAIACPRNRVTELTTWEEAKRPGVYILFGYDDENGESQAYIGEAEIVIDRLQNHLTNKDFWNEVIFFTNKDENLTKAHVKYLESKLVELGNRANRYSILNANTPQSPSLPRGDRDSMEEFIDQIKALIGVLGHKIFVPYSLKRTKIFTSDEEIKNESEIIEEDKIGEMEFSLSMSGIVARAMRTNEGILVLEGSEASKTATDSLSPGYQKLREKLINQNVLTEKVNKYAFTKDYLFSSPSSSAAIILGYATNGRRNWKNTEGKSIDDLEKESQKKLTLDDL